MAAIWFWLAAAAMAAAVAIVLVSVLLRARAAAGTAADFDMRVYRDQLAEVERDQARGIIPAQEAGRLRTEVQRRLLEADRAARGEVAPALVTGRPVAVAALIVLMLAGAFWGYWRLGAPGYPDLPLQLRLALADEIRATRPSQAEAEVQAALPPAPTDVDPAFLDLMDKLRAAVALRPNDVQGLQLLARNEAVLGNFTAAIAAQTALIGARGAAATAEDQAGLAELLIIAAGGFVSPEAEAVLQRALQADPANGTARYFAGLMFAQIGRFDQTFSLWQPLLAQSTDAAPWVAPIRTQIEDIAFRAGINYNLPPLPALSGPDAADIAAAEGLEAADRVAMIEGMVAQLGARLAEEGGEVEEWARLISSLAVLGRLDEARTIYAEAQERFAGLAAELGFLREAALTAGVTE